MAFFDCKDFKSGCHPSAKISVFSENRKRESFVLHDELILGITGVCMWFLGVRLFAQIRSIFLHIDQYVGKMETMIDGCCVLLNQKFGMKSEAIREIVYQNIEKMSEKYRQSISRRFFDIPCGMRSLPQNGSVCSL